ncbi:hypothetical protein Poly51_01950 [Rubripirellula tenax]|uniref:Uncharacterized protein n=1 Tax=Rubripirellula tenax TaxID=2528015 RepID=A0A5C6FJT8_9BACT|nr:hypothetical protein [Rubripirellula tenax]TWU59922.1 hypothetical protein Poly51_01950 [Rubripirellula tenax]
MRNRFSCLMLVAFHLFTSHLLSDVALLSNVALGDDPLFSEIAMDSVFTTAAVASSDVATRTEASGFDRITGPSSLTTALESAGFITKQNKERISIKVENAGWKFPVSMTIDVEADRIECRMSLVKIDPGSVSSEMVLALMAVNKDVKDASFVFDGDEKMIRLQTAFTNRNVTTKELKRQLSNLANVAIAHSDTWIQLKTKSTPSSDSPTTAETRGTSTAASTPAGQASIFGKWAGSLPSDASIAVEFGASGTFKMVHLVGKKAAISSGTLVKNADQLTLSESGKADVKFQIVSVTSIEMQLRIVDSSGKSGLSIKFLKANP